MSDDLISNEMFEEEKVDKVRTSSAEIVVHGTKEKPYYEIEYFDLSDNEMHVGFSSYKLDVVFGYLEKYFEVMDEKEGSCLGSGDFWGDYVCQYHVFRDRTHGKKKPIERHMPKCTLFNKWLSNKYKKCEQCIKAVERAKNKN